MPQQVGGLLVPAGTITPKAYGEQYPGLSRFSPNARQPQPMLQVPVQQGAQPGGAPATGGQPTTGGAPVTGGQAATQSGTVITDVSGGGYAGPGNVDPVIPVGSSDNQPADWTPAGTTLTGEAISQGGQAVSNALTGQGSFMDNLPSAGDFIANVGTGYAGGVAGDALGGMLYDATGNKYAGLLGQAAGNTLGQHYAGQAVDWVGNKIAKAYDPIGTEDFQLQHPDWGNVAYDIGGGLIGSVAGDQVNEWVTDATGSPVAGAVSGAAANHYASKLGTQGLKWVGNQLMGADGIPVPMGNPTVSYTTQAGSGAGGGGGGGSITVDVPTDGGTFSMPSLIAGAGGILGGALGGAAGKELVGAVTDSAGAQAVGGAVGSYVGGAAGVGAGTALAGGTGVASGAAAGASTALSAIGASLWWAAPVAIAIGNRINNIAEAKVDRAYRKQDLTTLASAGYSFDPQKGVQWIPSEENIAYIMQNQPRVNQSVLRQNIGGGDGAAFPWMIHQVTSQSDYEKYDAAQQRKADYYTNLEKAYADKGLELTPEARQAADWFVSSFTDIGVKQLTDAQKAQLEVAAKYANGDQLKQINRALETGVYFLHGTIG